MAGSVSIQCPKCKAKLKLKYRKVVGKKVPCPKCKQPFVVKRRRGKERKRTNGTDVRDDQSGTNSVSRKPGLVGVVGDPFSERLRAADKPSLIALIVANLFPLVAVLFFGWGLGDALVLYWLETLVIGCYAVLRILLAGPWTVNEETGQRLIIKLLVAPFFCLHYGFFCAFHGLFLLALFEHFELETLGDLTPVDDHVWPGPPFNVVPAILANLDRWGETAVACLVVSHGVSFMRNYLGRGEYKSTFSFFEMFKPYGRIVLMHICLIVGAAAVLVFGSPVFLLILFVGMKLVVDLFFHLLAHPGKSIEFIPPTGPNEGPRAPRKR
jgi:ssDNA-binding Zn-finger/Zn-ribbon topoisomerase 1